VLEKRKLIMEKIAKLIVVVAVFANGEPPTDIDSLFAGKEFQLPPLDSSYRVNYNAVSMAKSSSKEQDDYYTLQFDAVADFDVAQARRAKLRTQTGYDIQMVFDAPFYKLRGGGFKSKLDADDKARELAIYNISAFSVKLR
jgi:Sporulation related domain.